MKKHLGLITLIMGISMSIANAQNVVDVHSHIIPLEYTDFLKQHNAELQEIFPLPEWNIEKHLHFMNEMGIDYSVLSLPAPQPYFEDSEESAKIIRKLNELSAEIKKKYPDKFKFFATLPLPNVDLAIEEAKYALDVLHADGIKLASNSYGQYLGDEELDNLMTVLNERNAVIFVHPHRPEPFAEKIIQTTPLAMYEYPAETTRAVINMISRNVPAKYPNIKIIIPHCGSFLPLAIPRMKAIFPAMKAKGLMQDIDWEKNLAALYYDLAGVPTPELIKTMLTITTPEHILYGSDYPYQPDNVLNANLNNLINALKDDKDLASLIDKILYENAKRLFERKNK